jgi:hypothetical protein
MNPTANNAERRKAARANKALIARRVDDVLRIRLDGAEFWNVRRCVSESEKKEGSAWFLPEGAASLSDATLWRYIAQADKKIAESCRASSKKLLRRHLAQRRHIYAKALGADELRTALAALDSEAELLGLFPPKRREISGPRGGPLQSEVTTPTVAETVHDLEYYRQVLIELFAAGPLDSAETTLEEPAQAVTTTPETTPTLTPTQAAPPSIGPFPRPVVGFPRPF